MTTRTLTRFLDTLSLNRTFDVLGTFVMNGVEKVGGISLLIYKTFRAIFKYKFNWKGLEDQLFQIGNRSISIVLLIAVFTGMVLALQFTVGLARFGLKMYAGFVVGLSIIRELGPVLTALMVAARVGSGITAELGSMVVTEQVMAIEAMGSNPYQKLVVPRVLATIIATPLLTIMANMVGILGGMVVTMMEAGVTSKFYMDQIWNTIKFVDFFDGIAKTFIFGFIIAVVACYEGLNTSGGTEGVGQATTRTVVLASVLIFVSDFFMTKLLLIF